MAEAVIQKVFANNAVDLARRMLKSIPSNVHLIPPAQDSRERALKGSHALAARASAEARGQAAEAWRRAPGNDSALGLARAYFPEFFDGTKEEPCKVPVNPAAALRVKLPATEAGVLEIATRGAVFRVRLEGEAAAAAEHGKAATFYGARHFWTSVGEHVAVEEQGEWLTQRVEEYVVMEGGARPFRATYVVTVPEGVEAVRNAGDYLEFLDGRQVPVLRMHQAVARDSAGLSRQGEVRLGGAVAEPMEGQGGLPRFTLKRRTVRVEMTVTLEGMAGPVVVDPGWSSTGAMASARNGHTATLLPSGQVLAAGGSGQASAEVYDPGTGTWAATGPMIVARSNHTATLLPSGQVLAAGGSGQASAEVYDPGTGTWAATGPMIVPRDCHTAALLPSGKVLVAGGSAGYASFLDSAEVYDPGTGTWAATASMTVARVFLKSTLLPSGKVLVTGGDNAYGVTASAEVYEPGTGTWTATGSMASPRYNHTATLLPSGKVLVAGGIVGLSTDFLDSAEVYDPGAGTWTSTGSMAVGRFNHAATLLPSGKVLVVGSQLSFGGDPASVRLAEVYDAEKGTWAPAGSIDSIRVKPAATLLPSGKVLLSGGTREPSTEVYDPRTGNSFFVQLVNQSGVEMRRWWVTTYYGTTGTYTSSMYGHLLENGGSTALGGIYSAGSGGVNVQVMFEDTSFNLWSTPGWTYINIPTELPEGSASVCQIVVGPSQSSAPAVKPLSAQWASGGGVLQPCFYVGDRPTPATVSIVGPAKVSPAVLYLANTSGDPLQELELAPGASTPVKVFYVSDLLNPRPEDVTSQVKVPVASTLDVCGISQDSPDGITLQANKSGVTNLTVAYKGYSNFVRVTVRERDRS